MKNWFLDNFEFSKRELNGLLFLIILILIISFSPFLFEKIWINNPSMNKKEALAIQKIELADRYEKEKYQQNDFYKANKITKEKPNYYLFNPNTATEKDWQQFGLSSKQAKVVVNYIAKGGHFYKPEDLKKMFVINEQKFEELLPFISIAPKEEKSKINVKAPQIIEINSADTLKLTEIKGIGASFARRIAKYRERLGGFHQKEQLLEVYGLDSLKFNEIKNQITIEPNLIRKIGINSIEFENLKSFPYLKYKEMNAIIQYRKQHGKFKNIEDLHKIIILSRQTIERIAPYLNFE